MIKKNTEPELKKFFVYKEGTKKILFTVWYIIFPSKTAVNTDEAKTLVRKATRKSKYEIMSRYDVMYGKAHKTRSGITFTSCPKPLSNVIFVFQDKNRRAAKKAISEVKV